MTKININADIFSAVGMFASTEETRYYLRGVHILPKPDPATGRGVLMIATDGHKLAAIHDPDGSTEAPVTVSTDFKAKALKTTRSDGGNHRRIRADIGDTTAASPGEVFLAIDGDPDGFARAEAHVTLTNPGGTFPDFWRVIPLDCLGKGISGQVAFNPVYVSLVRAAIDRSGITADSKALSLHQRSTGDPILVTTGHMTQAVFVVMPMRCDDIERPFWLPMPPKAAPEAEAEAA